jgi:hypothetical protein
MLVSHSSAFLTEIARRLYGDIDSLQYPHFIKSIYVVGGNVEVLATNRPLKSPDVDLLVVVDRELAPGERPVRRTFMEAIVDGLTLQGQRLSVIFNGVAPLDYDFRDVLVDVLGATLSEAHQGGDAIITALKPRILLYGADLYRHLEGRFVDPSTAADVTTRMTKYVRREFFGRDDRWSVRAIAKNAIFLASLSCNEAVCLNDRAKIVRIVSHQIPRLAGPLAYFLQVVKDCPVQLQRDVESHFEELSLHLREINEEAK